MAKIVRLQKLKSIVSSIKKDSKSIVVAGGCFDILHIGHVKFLNEAKKNGDFLIVLLESDKKVTKLKGINRPIFKQEERAIVLSTLNSVDYVILLPFINTDEEYSQIISDLKSDIIAVTENDPFFDKKKHQAEKVKGKLKIIPYVETLSSSKLAELIGIK